MQEVLILGAGMVASPMVKYLLDHSFAITLADVDISKAIKIIDNHPNGKAKQIDANDDESIEKLASNANLVVSLLPFAYHPKILKICIKLKKNMVTTSYLKPIMKEMEAQVKEAGIIMLNEVGVDPGIDHMSAMRLIDKIHDDGGEIIDFYSFCGALPAPEAINNPFKYRFSWSPRGVLLAGKNPATYKVENKIIEVSAKKLFQDLRIIDFKGVGSLEVYPNRNSLEYIDLYGVSEATTVMRGTIRYPGWSAIIDSMKKLDLFSEEIVEIAGKTYADLLAEQMGVKNTDKLKLDLAAYLGIDVTSNVIVAIDYAGYFSNQPINKNTNSWFDISADLMISKMILNKSEKDMIVMMHCFKYKASDGDIRFIKATLKEFGDDKNTAVARTVALPAAISVRMILEGKIKLKGVFIPNIPEIYNPVLDELETMGIRMHEEFDCKEHSIRTI
ncbi:MAG: saccharopine dehydrogenase [Bacteroidetes bacterium]|nr:saccharopine dehydrogenase [Bacteroidota bacterium]MBT7827731.1 saccharopine dehydrogenase [Bacteroidota bacterium]